MKPNYTRLNNAVLGLAQAVNELSTAMVELHQRQSMFEACQNDAAQNCGAIGPAPTPAPAPLAIAPEAPIDPAPAIVADAAPVAPAIGDTAQAAPAVDSEQKTEVPSNP